MACLSPDSLCGAELALEFLSLPQVHFISSKNTATCLEYLMNREYQMLQQFTSSGTTIMPFNDCWLVWIQTSDPVLLSHRALYHDTKCLPKISDSLISSSPHPINISVSHILFHFQYMWESIFITYYLLKSISSLKYLNLTFFMYLSSPGKAPGLFLMPLLIYVILVPANVCAHTED